MNRRSILAVVAVVAVVAAGLGWVFGQRIQSPAEVAAAAAAPDPSLITVPVELRELNSRVVVRGTVESTGSTPIEVSGSTEGAAIITRLPVDEGDELGEGDVAIEVAGRPVIVLQGDLPEYRSLAPGMDGPDVRQLELALARLGYDPGTIDGDYTVATGRAVADLYSDAGYRANVPSSEDESMVSGLADQVTASQRALDGARSETTSSGLPRSQLLQLDQQIVQAKEAIADAEALSVGAQAEANKARLVAEEERESANKSLDDAKKRLSDAEAGSNPDTGEPPTEDELAELRGEVAGLTEVAAAADEASTQAASAYEVAKVEGERSIRDAETQLKISEASKQEAIAGASGGGETGGESIADLQRRLTADQKALNEARARTGVTLPAAEFRFVKTLPSVVQAVDVRLGEVPSGAALTVSGSSTLVRSSVSAVDRKLLEEGMTATVEDADIGISFEATITALADKPGGDDLSADRHRLVFTPNTEPPDDALFQSLRVTIPVSSTGGEVLAVPLAAVSAAADGSSRVEVEDDDGGTLLVPVTTGLAADGYVEVRPSKGSLKAGDRVVVGRDLLLPDGDDDADDDSDSESDSDSGGDGAEVSDDAAEGDG